MIAVHIVVEATPSLWIFVYASLMRWARAPGYWSSIGVAAFYFVCVKYFGDAGSDCFIALCWNAVFFRLLPACPIFSIAYCR